MKNDVTDRGRRSYDNSRPCCGPGEICGGGGAWNDPFTRRKFLKGMGGATAGTMLALHGMRIEVLAGDSASGSNCPLLPRASNASVNAEVTGEGASEDPSIALGMAIYDAINKLAPAQRGTIFKNLCNATYVGEIEYWEGGVLAEVNSELWFMFEDNKWHATVTLPAGSSITITYYEGVEC